MSKNTLFENKEEALKLLEDSRKQIDKIDNDLVDLIYRRTSLAKDIVFAKQYLDMDIYDKEREKSLHDKVNKLAIDKNIDEEILSEIMNMLTILSKNEQEEILRRNENG
ncbi:chorismate mutase [Methanobrevibacter sp. DSM 116169]|uniref:chorismate mutase n=1 Tax=Methanobrevibacter sp. DSM 116169 TaxID=3242727 RepID=UPI0038FCA569